MHADGPGAEEGYDVALKRWGAAAAAFSAKLISLRAHSAGNRAGNRGHAEFVLRRGCRPVPGDAGSFSSIHAGAAQLGLGGGRVTRYGREPVCVCVKRPGRNASHPAYRRVGPGGVGVQNSKGAIQANRRANSQKKRVLSSRQDERAAFWRRNDLLANGLWTLGA